MLVVFRNDAAEAQRYYMSNCLNKPNRVPITQSVQCIQQLNRYVTSGVNFFSAMTAISTPLPIDTPTQHRLV